MSDEIKIIEREEEVEEIRWMTVKEFEEHCKQEGAKFVKCNETE